MTKYKVPEGMLDRSKRIDFSSDIERISFHNGMEFACSDLAENPIVPTREQAAELYELPFDNNGGKRGENRFTIAAVTEWQRRMFLAPEPEVPEELNDLLFPKFFNAMEIVQGMIHTRTEEEYSHSVIEAYRRGQKSK